MNILFVSSEVEDLAKTGGLADVAKALPLSFKSVGHDVRIVTPLYQTSSNVEHAKTILTNVTLHAGDSLYHYNVKQVDLHGVTVYLVDYPDYFFRKGIYSDGYHAYDDNGERYAFFSMAALHLAQLLEFKTDIIHCNDWHTGLIPFYLKKHWSNSEYLAEAKTVLSVHNGAFQGVFALDSVPFLQKSGVNYEDIHHGNINYLKIGVQYATKIVAVSPSYAQELQTDLGSHHMGDLFRSRSQDLVGIINGCDYTQWNPETDTMIPTNYSAEDMNGKAFCKANLQQHSHLPVDGDIPLIGMVCRITDQKGFSYLIPIIKNILHHNVQLVLIGTGDPELVRQIQSISDRHRNKFFFMNDFSLSFSHLVTAGSDFFLMPSLFEPCGLNQMYSLAYGTLPIVRAVGGLKDTVIDLEADPINANGFVFDRPDSEALLNCIRKALLFYHEYPQTFDIVRKKSIQTHFNWHDSAMKYEALYRSIN
ncbi:glycogen synthase GlgA [Catenovulum adriaticum]|uniref:Glycogen synthase n=1 Tax=Catenovulum adriaticum TaxID=2984846 RepID=A0ABY7AM77_9ALTE|nr:glycogen synthase GlgA [Catenovulum sp. TS8]WAJ70663.1 glycogen synthase GlgA [Catenovulum sp. TS8]